MRAHPRSTLLAFFAAVALSGHVTAASAQTRMIPHFEADPSWPKLPSKWVWGQVSSVSIDSQGHAWILQRPSTVRNDQKGMAAPPVLEFDEAGNFIQGWGGPGQGYDWPETEHGIYADPKGYIWLGGNGKTDHHLVKFTRDGKFVMQIGHKGQSKGNKDTTNVNQAADTFVYAPTNELFVADGYGNRRIIVFDADTGAFKRMWGAFGNERSTMCRRSRRWRKVTASPPGSRPDLDHCSSCSRSTRRGCRTTASSTSPTAAASACRCSRSTASS